MNRRFMTIILTLALVLTAGPVFAEQKIGYLDLSRVFDEYQKTKEYDAALEVRHNAFEKERNVKIDKLKEAQGKMALLKEDEKAKVQQEIESLRADLMEFDRQNKTDLTKERDEKIREILLEIEKVVSDYAKKQNYSFIFNDRVLIYGAEPLNVSEDVLKILNAGYSK